MSRSSAPERTGRGRIERRRTERGQTEPVAALAAVVAVCLATSLYAGFLADALPGNGDRSIADATLERVWLDVGEDGVASTDDLRTLDPAIVPSGYTVTVSIVAVENGEARSVVSVLIESGRLRSPVDAPDDASTASRPVGVARGPGDVRAGRLRVEVWS